jgi:hypothetical protein
MDFHTMVSNFRRTVLKEQEELEELSKGARERVKKYIRDGTPGRHTPQYSFDNLFGDNETMRAIVPLEASIRIGGTKLFKRIVDQGWAPNFTTRKIKQKKQRLAAAGGGEYEEEFDAPVLTMVKSEERTIPAGPRKGEVITSTKKMSLGKLVQRLGTEEDKAWWAENQSDVQTGADAVENMRNYFLKPWMNEFKGIGSNRPIIVISRYPMDVARMSDFSMTHSCHSEDGGYFNCAIHESKGHGLVAFLIKPEDVEEITQLIERGDEEIFGDNNINDLQGLPEPIARVRLYKLYNSYTEEEFAVPEERVYGMNIPDFLPTVRAWARENQKDIWSGDTDGEKLDLDALDSRAWTRVGGSYTDAEQSGTGIGGLIAAMFEQTKFSEEAEEFEERDYEYEDLYDEDNEEASEMQEAEDRLEVTLGDARNNSNNIDFYGQIEEGWDEMPWYLQGGCGFQLAIPLTAEESKKIPEGSYSATRGFVEDLTSVMENYEPWSKYDGWELEYEVDGAAYTGAETDELQIKVRGAFHAEQGGMEQVSDFDYWVREVIENMDEKMESMKGAIRAKLIELGIKAPGAYEDAVEEMVEEVEYENFTILYDEDDPADGIDIVLHTSKTEKMELMKARPSDPSRYFKVITTVPAFDANGNPTADRFKYLLDRDSGSLMARVRINFRTMLKQAQRAAKKQVSLPLGDKYTSTSRPIVVPAKDLKIFIAAARSPFRTAGGVAPRQTRYMSDEQQDAQSKKPMQIGYRFQFKIGQEITTDEYEEIKAFLDYLDSNLESFEDSIVDEVNKLYQDAAEQVAYNVDQGRKYGTPDQQSRMDKMTRRVQPAADAAPEQIAEAKMRAAIRKVIRKHLLREQEEKFQTRMFQVSLRLQFTKGTGGGIEQKLNRIRAIDGVTVVGHAEGEKIGDQKVIEAKVKFHPESDSLRPMSYVRQVLVPDINSSRAVPGVKVIEIVSGTLKRLDK